MVKVTKAVKTHGYPPDRSLPTASEALLYRRSFQRHPRAPIYGFTSSVRFEYLKFQRQQGPASDADELIGGFGRTGNLKQSVLATPRARSSGTTGIDLRHRSDLTREFAHAHGLRLERGIALTADVVEATRRAARVNDVR